MSHKIILAVLNDLAIDQRVHKIALSFQERGYEVVVVGVLRKDSREINRAYPTHRITVKNLSGPKFYFEFNRSLYHYLSDIDYDILWANDLDVLMGAYVSVKKKRKSGKEVKLIYDSHELFPELPELVGRRFKKNLWTLLEKFLISRVDEGVTVCPSIQEILTNKSNIPFRLLRNMPIDDCSSEKRSSLDEKVLIYQGAVNLGRGLKLMIDSLEFNDFRLMIVGGGDCFEDIQEYASTRPFSDRIDIVGRVPFEELKTYTRKASIGLSLEEDLGLNYRFALPNKIFDYVRCGLPSIVSDLPEMGNLVRSMGIGEVLVDRTPQGLSSLVLEVYQNRYSYVTQIENATSQLHWDNDFDKLFKQLEIQD